jgi:hypothetical protein
MNGERNLERGEWEIENKKTHPRNSNSYKVPLPKASSAFILNELNVWTPLVASVV